MISNQTSRYIRECIRIIYLWCQRWNKSIAADKNEEKIITPDGKETEEEVKTLCSLEGYF